MDEYWYPFFKLSLVLVLLAILGLNVFNYLAKTTDILVDATEDVVGKTAGVLADVSEKTIKTADVGAKATVDVVAGATKSAINVSSGVLAGGINELGNVLDTRSSSDNQTVPSADETDSKIQHSLKTGFCYIGMDRGVRSCLEVGRNDMCMSDKVYPTMEVCINPNLRV